MKKIVFATNNQHKLEEVSAIVGGSFEIVTLASTGITEEIPETSDTLDGNALQKARYVYERTGLDCFADDTGLEVAALGGEPGVHSARYATDGHDHAANRALLLSRMEGKTDRSARFRTVIALIRGGEEVLCEGEVRGTIAEAERGDKGFGYDSLFIPEGHSRTFAEMSAEEKNSLSHRARAVEALAKIL